MDNYYFMKHVLAWLAKPLHFNRMLAIAMRVTGVLVVPFSLVPFFKAGKVIFDLPASEILGGILFQVFFVVAIYCVVHALFIRARDVDALPGGDFNIFPLSALILKGLSEAAAALLALVSVGGGIYVWFTGKGVATILNPLPALLPVIGVTNFMGGIQFMVGGVLTALAVLVLGYLSAEFLNYAGRAARRYPEPRTLEAVEPQMEETEVRLRSGTDG